MKLRHLFTCAAALAVLCAAGSVLAAEPVVHEYADHFVVELDGSKDAPPPVRKVDSAAEKARKQKAIKAYMKHMQQRSELVRRRMQQRQARWAEQRTQKQ